MKRELFENYCKAQAAAIEKIKVPPASCTRASTSGMTASCLTVITFAWWLIRL